MIIKDAFRYQNHLSRLLDMACLTLEDRKFTTRTTQVHNMSKTNKDAEDETIEVPCECRIDCGVSELIDFAEHVISEKAKLMDAILSAKKYSCTGIDENISLSKDYRKLYSALSNMAQIKDTERTYNGTAFKFNAEGNQVSYTYPMIEITKTAFKRSAIKQVAKTIITLADEKSTEVDRAMVNILVDYEPEFDVNGSFEDAVEVYLAQTTTPLKK